jgi:hypothetical protein
VESENSSFVFIKASFDSRLDSKDSKKRQKGGQEMANKTYSIILFPADGLDAFSSSADDIGSFCSQLKYKPEQQTGKRNFFFVKVIRRWRRWRK